jgi:hexulose-6-phosphate isomerase
MRAQISARFPLVAGALALGLLLVSAAAAQIRVNVADKPKESAKPGLKQAIKFEMIGIEGTIEEKFALVKTLGFAGVEIDSPTKLDRAEIVAAAAKTGVVVHGVIDAQHWEKRFSDPDAQVRAQAVETLRGAIDDARRYGASTVLVVPGAVRDKEKENYEQVWQRSHAEIAKVLPYAKEKGVKIAIEVVWNDFITKPEELAKYVDEFNDPTVGAYYDCSNTIKYGVPSAEWITKLGKRVLKVDFKGYSKAKGWVAIGEGDEDWPAVLEALAKIGYDGWMTAEVERGGREHLADVKKRMDKILMR